MEPPKLYIVIPVYNEGAALRRFFDDLDKQLQKQNLSAILVVVDDGSTDPSVKVMDELKDKVALLRHPTNMGIAKALETGFSWVLEKAEAHDRVAVLESDGTNDAGLLGRMCARLDDGFDVVIGSRLLPGGGMRGFPFKRRALSILGNLMMRYRIGYPGVRDYTIFFRAYRLEALHAAAENGNGSMFHESGFEANAEILLRIAAAGMRVTELPHIYRYDLKKSSSKMDPKATIRGYLKLINRYRKPVQTALLEGRLPG